MDDWRAFLDHETRTCVAGLELIGCRFTWRDELTYGRPERIWFEIWRHGRLLNIAGPFPQPVRQDALDSVRDLILVVNRFLAFTQQY